MSGRHWEALSSWHNAWLAADAAGRDRLRAEIAETAPELVEDAERLIAVDPALPGFLETPALVLAASELAASRTMTLEDDEPHLSPPDPHAKTTSDAIGPSRRGLWLAACAIAILSAAAGWHMRSVPAAANPELPLVRFSLPLPPGLELRSAPQVSPDGQRIAFVAGNLSGSRLLVRELGSEPPRIIAGSEDAAHPFWSPDGKWVGFSARGRVMKVAVVGGSPLAIEGAHGEWGAAWSSSNTLVYQPALRDMGLLRIPASGGRAAPATTLDAAAHDISHTYPAILPDGSRFLYYLASIDDRRRGMYLASLDAAPTTPTTRLGTLDAHAIFVPLPGEPEGLLLWAVGGRVTAQSFDPSRRALGEPRTIDLAVAPNTPYFPAMLSATADVLVYATSVGPRGGVAASSNQPGDEQSPREIEVVLGWRALLR